MPAIYIPQIRRVNSGASWHPSCQKLLKMAEIICQNSRTFVMNWNYLAEFTHFCRELIIIDKIHALLSKILSFYISLKNLYEKSVKIIAQYKQVLLSSVFSMQKIFIIQQKWFLWTNEAVKWFLSIVRITVPAYFWPGASIFEKFL